jgi:hypothetical protein
LYSPRPYRTDYLDRRKQYVSTAHGVSMQGSPSLLRFIPAFASRIIAHHANREQAK